MCISVCFCESFGDATYSNSFQDTTGCNSADIFSLQTMVGDCNGTGCRRGGQEDSFADDLITFLRRSAKDFCRCCLSYRSGSGFELPHDESDRSTSADEVKNAQLNNRENVWPGELSLSTKADRRHFSMSPKETLGISPFDFLQSSLRSQADCLAYSDDYERCHCAIVTMAQNG